MEITKSGAVERALGPRFGTHEIILRHKGDRDQEPLSGNPCDPPLSSEPERLADNPARRTARARRAVYSFGGMKPRCGAIRFPEFFPNVGPFA